MDARQAPLAQEAVGNNPARIEKGSKRSLLVDGAGVLPSLIVSGANRHDVKLLAITLDSIVVVRPKNQPLPATKPVCGQRLCGASCRESHASQRLYAASCGSAGKKSGRQGHCARRWVVERTHSWFNRFRKLLVRYEKTAANFLALLQCAAALICWRMC